jgi:hypothetical protein
VEVLKTQNTAQKIARVSARASFKAEHGGNPELSLAPQNRASLCYCYTLYNATASVLVLSMSMWYCKALVGMML